MKKLCIFTGAANGSDPRFAEATRQLGQMLASRNLGLVYGGGKSGLMGKIADAVSALDGHTTGIIPKFLERVEIAHQGLTDLHVTDTMHQRKKMMYDIAMASSSCRAVLAPLMKQWKLSLAAAWLTS